MHSYRFGRIEIRSIERQLLVDGKPASLGARAFDLLLALVEHRDRVVSKNELLDRVWPGLVVEENNLQVQVSTLRKLLGARAIATIPGRGYRFALPSDAAAAAQPAPAVPCATLLPAPIPMLLGRDDELAALDSLLQRHRVVTVVGAGGIGKTTLALAAAHARQDALRDGAVWVDLAPVSDPAALPATVAQVLQAQLGGGEPLPLLLATLKPLQALLVLDNAEHLLDAAARLAQAVAAGAAGMRLLITSQAPLRIDGERVFRLGSLAVPEPGTSAEDALTYGAVALFADQAHAADRRFALTEANVGTVIDLCRHLDGMALAIKLAAARLPSLGLQGLHARLTERFRLLGVVQRSAPAHQQTLRAALDWSHGLLSGPEQTVFRRLGVFVGGFTLELAGAVASDDALDHWAVIDALGALVDRSLVAADGADAPRYRLLESAREYAWLRLDEAGEQQATQRRHAQAIAAWMRDADAAFWTTSDACWLAACSPEIDNVRAALDWSAQHDRPLAIALAGSSTGLFALMLLAHECRWRCAQLEGSVRGDVPAAAAARYWVGRSLLQIGLPAGPMHDFALAAAELYRRLDDARGRYLALSAVVGSLVAPLPQARRMLDEMTRLERPQWPPRLRRQRKWAEAAVLKSEGRMAEFLAAVRQALALANAAGADHAAVGLRSWLVEAHLALGQADEAVRVGRELILSVRAWRSRVGQAPLVSAANALLLQGDVREARLSLTEFIETSRRRDWDWFGYHADSFALLAALEGRSEAAARLIGYCDHARRRGGGRNLNAALARALAWRAVEAALDAATIERLMAEGASLDEEGACALALA